MICFQALEIGQELYIAPAWIAAFSPVVKIAALTTIENVSIDRTRSTEDLTAWLGYSPTFCPFARLTAVHPVNFWIKNGFDETGRNVNEWTTIHRPGFQQANFTITLLRQSIRDNAARTTGSNDDVVELLRHTRAWTLN